MSLNELAKEIHQNAIEHGWWETERSFGEIVALFHSELSEALEEFRDDHPHGVVSLHEKANGLNWKERSVIQHALRVSPTIDAEPVRHGRWLVDGLTGMSFCSECTDYAVEADTNYCPNCGAKMDLEV